MKLSNEKKKELQAAFKLLKPPMGIFAIINKRDSKYYLETTQNLTATFNSAEFKLNLGGHPQKQLQKDWLEIGKDGFEFKILEQIPYDKNETKTDYSEELSILKLIWVERLIEENMLLY